MHHSRMLFVQNLKSEDPTKCDCTAAAAAVNLSPYQSQRFTFVKFAAVRYLYASGLLFSIENSHASQR